MKKDDCIFCKIANGLIPSPALYEDDDFKVIFDKSPAAKGHALILPKEHFDNAFSMDEEYAAKVFPVAVKVSRAMKEVFDFEGMNILQNNEEIAGQTVFHFHMHLIPRYKNDNVNIGWKTGELSDADAKEYAESVRRIVK